MLSRRVSASVSRALARLPKSGMPSPFPTSAQSTAPSSTVFGPRSSTSASTTFLRSLSAASCFSTSAAAAAAPASAYSTPVTVVLPADIAKIRDGILSGCRRSLSRGITLVESTNPAHRELANSLLVSILAHMAETSQIRSRAVSSSISSSLGVRAQLSSAVSSGVTGDAVDIYAGVPASELAETILKQQRGRPRSKLRIGISGTPGVGKSTFIEAFGMYLTQKYGIKVSVLSIDPSSQITGGSILGDKTRMQQLSMETTAYVRPSPSRGTLGGVAQNTAEAVQLCEAAGYDVVLVETVGVGQSEVTVAQTVDMVIVLMGPGGGDELQGIKKGIMEVADMIVVTKADGALLGTAQRTRADYERGLSFYHAASLSYGWSPIAVLCSATEGTEAYLDGIWGRVLEFEHAMMKPAHEFTRNSRSFGHDAFTGWTSAESAKVAGKLSILHAKRAMQRRQWMWSQLNDELLGRMRKFAQVEGVITSVEKDLVENRLTSRVAAKLMLDAFIDAQVVAGHAGRHAAAPQHAPATATAAAATATATAGSHPGAAQSAAK